VKIAFIGGFAFSPKGTIRARAHPIAAELVRGGHEVTIFLPPYDNLEHSGLEWQQDGVRIHNVGLPVGAAKTRQSVLSKAIDYTRLLTELVGAVNQYRPDLIHIFKPKGFAGAAGTYFFLKGLRSIVLDCDDWEGRGGWNDAKTYPGIVKHYIDHQERWMMRTMPALTAASHVLEERARTIRGERESVYYVPNCGPSNGARDIQARVRARSVTETRRVLGFADGPIVLYSGHFEPAEDAEFFCRAAADVIEQNRASIIFIGDGPQLPRVRAFFSQRPGSRVLFLPQLPYEQFLRWVWAADIAAFPYSNDALHRAKCSARIVDYMAMGKPVLTSAVGQNHEYIVNGESGVLARPGDEKHFSEQLDHLLRNPQLCERLGQAAELRIREKFDWSGVPLQNCLAAYERVAHTQRN
jgi:glycosyltransferase involved in cell wall biosynthesis